MQHGASLDSPVRIMTGGASTRVGVNVKLCGNPVGLAIDAEDIPIEHRRHGFEKLPSVVIVNVACQVCGGACQLLGVEKGRAWPQSGVVEGEHGAHVIHRIRRGVHVETAPARSGAQTADVSAEDGVLASRQGVIRIESLARHALPGQ